MFETFSDEISSDSDVMLVWRKGNSERSVSCVTVLCTVIMVHSGTSSSYRTVDLSGFDLARFSSVFQISN